MTIGYQRKTLNTLLGRLSEPPRSIIFIAGPRQVGKTTLVYQALATIDPRNYHMEAIDQPISSTFLYSGEVIREENGASRDTKWLVRIWESARQAARLSQKQYILVLDEIQKLDGWSEIVKGLWDADRAENLSLHIILLGSSPLLMQKGMTESLAGRYELIRLTHWSFSEMTEAFDFDLNDYLYFGGYPGAAAFIREEPRWKNFVRDSLINPNIQKDILMMNRIDKPALLKQLFNLGCEYSGQLLAFSKMITQFQDAGNTVTLAHYLDLLNGAGLITGLQKYATQKIRRRASVNKFNVLNTALMSVASGYTKAEAIADRSYWGRQVESAIGAHLYNTSYPDCNLYYWRNDSYEIDFVVEKGHKLALIEVKSGRLRENVQGFDKFEHEFKRETSKIIVGEKGDVTIAEFLSYPAEHWF